jgi:hypothetical protein
VKALDDATRDNAALKRELTERNQVCDVVVIAYARVLNTSSSSSSSPPPSSSSSTGTRESQGDAGHHRAAARGAARRAKQRLGFEGVMCVMC